MAGRWTTSISSHAARVLFRGMCRLAAGVSTLRLAPFQREQVEQFVDAWARALFRVDAAASSGDAPAAEATSYRDELLEAIDAAQAAGPSRQVL